MDLLFLQTAPIAGTPLDLGGNPLSSILGPLIGIFIFFILAAIVLYIYLSIAYSKIGSKVGLSNPGIAWMPQGGPIAVIFESSKMHWWPFLVLTLGLVLGYILMMLSIVGSAIIGVIGSIVMIVTIIIFAIMSVIWHWKTYEAIGKPGWWILISVAPVVIGYVLIFVSAFTKILALAGIGMIIAFLGVIAHLVMIGIAAWSKQ